MSDELNYVELLNAPAPGEPPPREKELDYEALLYGGNQPTDAPPRTGDPGVILPARESSQTPGRSLVDVASETVSGAVAPAVEFGKRAIESVKGSISGESTRQYDFPEIDPAAIEQLFPTEFLGESKAERIRQMFEARSPIAQARIFQTVFPDHAVDFDEFGNAFTVDPFPTIEYTSKGEGGLPGSNVVEQRVYLNRSGLSQADKIGFGREAAAITAGAVPGAKLGQFVAGRAGRIAGAMIGTTAAAVGEDIFLNAIGSEEGVDAVRAGILGMFAGGAETAVMLASPSLRWLQRVLKNKSLRKPTGELNDAGRKVFENADVNPDIVNRQFSDDIFRKAEEAVREGERLQKGIPGPEVPITKGLATKDVTQQKLENQILQGTYGETPRQILRAGVDQTEDALKANRQAIGKALGIGFPEDAPVGEGVGPAVAALKRVAGVKEAEYKAAYEAIEEGKAFIPKESMDRLGARVETILTKKRFIKQKTAVNKKTGEQRRFIDFRRKSELKRQFDDLAELAEEGDVDVVDLVEFRAMLSSEITDRVQPLTKKLNTEGAALQIIKNEFDGMIAKTLKASLLRGDPKVIAKWAEATSLRSTYGKMFQRNKIVREMVRDELTPEQAVKTVFGAARLGPVSKAENIGALKLMRKTLGPKSDEWLAVKEEAFLRLFRNQPTEGFSARKFITEYDDAMNKARTLMDEVFTKEDLKMIKSFRDISERTIFDPDALQPSKTASHLAQIVLNMFGPAGKAALVLGGRIGKPFMEVYGRGEAKAAMQRGFALSQKPLFTPGAFGALGATAAERVPVDLGSEKVRGRNQRTQPTATDQN